MPSSTDGAMAVIVEAVGRRALSYSGRKIAEAGPSEPDAAGVPE
jgi:hypothetical protein